MAEAGCFSDNYLLLSTLYVHPQLVPVNPIFVLVIPYLTVGLCFSVLETEPVCELFNQ